MMPKMDGTGPRWANPHGAYGYGCRMGRRCGFGQDMSFFQFPTEKEALAAQKEALKQRLAELDKRLETL